MSNSLKKIHTQKKLIELQNKLKRVDESVINDFVTENLIYEAFDKQQMSAAVDIIKKLKSIDFKSLTSLSQARDIAVAEVTKVLGGSKDQGIVRKIVSLFKDEKENPLIDTLAFADALHNFFTQFTEYINALNSSNKDKNATLGSVVTGKSQDELDDMGSIDNLGTEEKKKLADLQSVIVKGMKPEGALANIGKNWVDKYMKGKKGLSQLAKDLLKMSVKDLQQVSNSVTSSLKNTKSVGEAAAGAAEQGTVSSTASTGTEQATIRKLL